MSVNKLSLEERLKLAASTGGKKKSKLKRNLANGSGSCSSRDITPNNASEIETEPVVANKAARETESEEPGVEKKEQEEVVATSASQQPNKEVDEASSDHEHSSAAQETSQYEQPGLLNNVAELLNESFVETDDEKEPDEGATEAEETKLDSKAEEQEIHSSVKLEAENLEAAAGDSKGNKNVSTLSFSPAFLTKFKLSPVYYKNIADLQDLATFESSVFEKFQELENKYQQDLEKLNKKDLRLNNQIASLQKEKLKVDMKAEKLNKDFEIKSKKIDTVSLELDKIKTKYDEISKLYSDLSDRENIIKKENQELLSKNAAFTTQLADLSSNLNNYQLDNSSYAEREEELINEIGRIKEDNERDIALLENKLEHYKIKLENYHLINSEKSNASKQTSSELEEEIEQLNTRLREQDDIWFKKYDVLSRNCNYTNETNKELVSKNNEISKKLDGNTSVITKLKADSKTLSEENEKLTRDNKNLNDELENLKNQTNNLKKDLKLLTETNRIQANQLQEFFKEEKFVNVSTKKKTSIPTLKTPEESNIYKPDIHANGDKNEDERKALNLQLQNEWNINGNDLRRSSLQISNPSLYNISEAESLEDNTLLSPRETNLGIHKFNFKHKQSNPISQQMLDVDEEDPLLVRRISAVQQNQSGESNNNNIHLISRLSSQVRQLETDLTSCKQSKEKLVKEKLVQQRKLAEISSDLEYLSSLKHVNDDLIQEKLRLSERFETLEHTNLLKDRKILELTEDLKDLKQMMHKQIQQMVDMQDKMV